ncbi:MAG: nodulation protein NodH [Paracoccaceae bacterium]|nr:nodulation protein NodH [Paracoccaceae bacterium]
MTKPFDYFVIFAEMRTGSNLLEANLNSFDGMACYGEAFNPVFVGHRNKTELFGISMEQREKDPIQLIRVMIAETDGLPGFRFFHDHDPRVQAHCLADPRCGKIILTRNPAESFVSLKIAQQTGQWKLGDIKNHKTAKVTFNAAEFEQHLETLQQFQLVLLHALQASGQTAFYVNYEDLQDVEVMNGLARFLGVDAQITAISRDLVKQNPEDIADKVVNATQMEAALARLDRFNLSRTPNFEPRRAAQIPAYVAAANAPLLYLPIKSGPEDEVMQWLRAIGGGLTRDFTHKSLRQWKRDAEGFRSFTVLRHPLARAHAAFTDLILPGKYPEIRQSLRRLYKVQLPADVTEAGYDIAAHRATFHSFLRFLKGNLAGQTSIRVDAAWATQSAVLQGYASVGLPDLVLREDRMAEGLAYLASDVGLTSPGLGKPSTTPRHSLADIYDTDLEGAARDAYARDYAGFGFGSWR